MKPVAFAILMVLTALLGRPVLYAQASRGAVYDMSVSTTLKGTVSAVLLPTGAPVFLVVEIPTASGTAEQWAIEGAPAPELIAAGWRPRAGTPVGPGAVIEVVVHPVKAGVDALTFVPNDEPALVASAKARRIAYGTRLTVGGQTVAFGSER